MAVLDILTYPDPVLREKTEKVTSLDFKLLKLIADMKDTMHFSNGIGLAAPQVGHAIKLVVMDWEEHRYVLINPEILEAEGEEIYEEGCLSFPGVFENVTRPDKIRVRYIDEEWNECEEVIEGFLARIFCHEVDHLNSKLLIDHLSPLKRTFLKKRMDRKSKESG